MNIILNFINVNIIKNYKNLIQKTSLWIIFYIISSILIHFYIFIVVHRIFLIYRFNFFFWQDNKIWFINNRQFYLFFVNWLNYILSFNEKWFFTFLNFQIYINYFKYLFLTDILDLNQQNVSVSLFNYLNIKIYKNLIIFFNTSFLKYIEYISIITLQLFLLFLSIWTRACGPRVRLDQLSNLTWKELLITLIVILINIFLLMFFL